MANLDNSHPETVAAIGEALRQMLLEEFYAGYMFGSSVDPCLPVLSSRCALCSNGESPHSQDLQLSTDITGVTLVELEEQNKQQEALMKTDSPQLSRQDGGDDVQELVKEQLGEHHESTQPTPIDQSIFPTSHSSCSPSPLSSFVETEALEAELEETWKTIADDLHRLLAVSRRMKGVGKQLRDALTGYQENYMQELHVQQPDLETFINNVVTSQSCLDAISSLSDCRRQVATAIRVVSNKSDTAAATTAGGRRPYKMTSNSSTVSAPVTTSTESRGSATRTPPAPRDPSDSDHVGKLTTLRKLAYARPSPLPARLQGGVIGRRGGFQSLKPGPLTLRDMPVKSSKGAGGKVARKGAAGRVGIVKPIPVTPPSIGFLSPIKAITWKSNLTEWPTTTSSTTSQTSPSAQSSPALLVSQTTVSQASGTRLIPLAFSFNPSSLFSFDQLMLEQVQSPESQSESGVDGPERSVERGNESHNVTFDDDEISVVLSDTDSDVETTGF